MVTVAVASPSVAAELHTHTVTMRTYAEGGGDMISVPCDNVIRSYWNYMPTGILRIKHAYLFVINAGGGHLDTWVVNQIRPYDLIHEAHVNTGQRMTERRLLVPDYITVNANDPVQAPLLIHIVCSGGGTGSVYATVDYTVVDPVTGEERP